VYTGAPARLIVRRIDGIERATLVRQPRFDEPGLEQSCCLLLHDVVFRDGSLQLVEVAPRAQVADAVLAIDMDGDDTDELLVTRGLQPLGDTTYPTDARLLRWAGDRFAEPVLTELLVGSGASPFVLGDSDGVPGAEAAFIGAQSRLHRVSLREGDALVAESAEAGTVSALAVPIGLSRGIATTSEIADLQVRPWPRDAPPGPPVAARHLTGDLVGITAGDNGRAELVLRLEGEAVVYMPLPGLDPIYGPNPRLAVRNVTSGPLQPFIGPVPGGGQREEAVVLAEGRLTSTAGEVASTSALAGVVPVGLVGSGRAWLALWHGLRELRVLDPAGGRLDAPSLDPGSGVSLVPFDEIREPEGDDGTFDPAVDRAVRDEEDDLLVSGNGFEALVDAPPGSRVYVQIGSAFDDEVPVVPDVGTIRVDIEPPDDAPPGRTLIARLAVVTPAGRGYTARWAVRVLDSAPTLTAGAETSIGAPSVIVAGRAGTSDVTVAGRPVAVDEDGRFSIGVDLPPWPSDVEVVATDVVGNESRITVIGIGWFDFRTLPWIAMALAGLGAVGAWLYLRAPGVRERPIAAGDDGVLEELDPGDL
jgi:hypothetical protein